MGIALITGATGGIGSACAGSLSAAGHRVALVARSASALDTLAATLPGPARSIVADVTDPAAPGRVFGELESDWGTVEVLVIGAGAGFAAPLADTTDADWDRMIALNLTAPFRWVRRAAPPMVERGSGRIVVVASVAAKQGATRIAAYAASKHGVLGLVRAAAAELARAGVTVNAVCPGYVDTPMTDATVADIAARTGRTPDQARDLLARQQATGRLVTPAEVAQAVMLCVTNPAITGQGINVDGGTVQS